MNRYTIHQDPPPQVSCSVHSRVTVRLIVGAQLVGASMSKTSHNFVLRSTVSNVMTALHTPPLKSSKHPTDLHPIDSVTVGVSIILSNLISAWIIPVG